MSFYQILHTEQVFKVLKSGLFYLSGETVHHNMNCAVTL